MRFAIQLTIILCSLFVVGWATAAQQQTSAPPTGEAVTTQPPPARKANARPANSTVQAAAEPFDKATVEGMAGKCVKLETEAGAIEIEMLAEAAPETVRNFLNLTANGAFDTTTFSRVVKGFVVQGGNLSTRQTVTPELVGRMKRTVADEPNYVKHVRGVVSMARSEQANSATTNFFILIGDAVHLDGKFAAFGRVLHGMDTADAINNAPVEGEKPLKPVRVTRAVVATCPAPAETPKL